MSTFDTKNFASNFDVYAKYATEERKQENLDSSTKETSEPYANPNETVNHMHMYIYSDAQKRMWV